MQMGELVAHVAGLRKDPSELEQLLRQSEERLLMTDDELELAAVELTITRMKNRIEAIPTWNPRVPDYAFDGLLEIHGTERGAVLRTLGRGHSASDSFLLLPDDGIVFAGDLAHFQQQPFMGSCDAKAWTEQIEFLEAMDVAIIVPGHGPVGTKTEIYLQKQYISELQALVRQAREHAKPVGEALKLRLPTPFDAWQDQDRGRFATNVRAEYIRQSDAEEGGR
jgi:glyoxylase-like metal-dependent hydrolase (beta-lactamase superfamily II)